jgi:hypothetical protein
MSRTAERIRYVVAAERDRSTLGRRPNNRRESSPAVAKTLWRPYLARATRRTRRFRRSSLRDIGDASTLA